MPATTFTTRICPITIEFSDQHVTRLRLHSRLENVGAGEACESPAWVQSVISDVQRHMAGEVQDFRGVPLALTGVGDFAQSVYAALRQVAPGQTVTYGELAARVGRPNAARAVGRAMAGNPLPLLIPCHRVIGANGRLTGFSGADGCLTKAQILTAEGFLPGITSDSHPF